MKVWDGAAHGWALTGSVFLGGAGAGAIAVNHPELASVLFVGAVIWYLAIMRRSFRRRRAVTRPFSSEWREILERNVPLYNRLSEERKEVFERHIRIFMAENRFVGVRGVKVTEELKILAAASAVMLLFGRTDLEYPSVSKVIFYPEPFDEQYNTEGAGRNILGLFHPYGAVALSAPSLKEGFVRDYDGHHVGLHEFAHALDVSAQECDGIPLGINPRMVRPWTELMHRQIRQARRGRGVLGSYAGKNEAEFFAVAVEVFFEQPDLLRRHHPELFGLLDDYFGRGPTSQRSEAKPS